MRFALTLGLISLLARAEDPIELLTPKAAWLELESAAGKLGRREGWTFAATGRKEFLAVWAKSGKKAEGEQAYYLGLFLSGERRTVEAAQAYRKAIDVLVVAQDARIRFLAATLMAAAAGKAGREDFVDARKAGEKALAAAEEATVQGRIQIDLGLCCERLGDGAAAIEWWTAAASADPKQASRVALLGAELILRIATDAQEARTRTDALVNSMLALHASVKPDSGRVAEMTARRTADQIARAGNAARLLGEPLPPWNALHVFGDAKAAAGYKGRVMLIHVGSTWSMSTVRALPVLRDLHAAYKDRCAFVGLWIGGMSFYESRFELDEDFLGKANGTTPVTLRRVLSRPGQPKGPSEEEIEVHRRFFANHKLSWDHVRVPLVEHSKTYGVLTQPLLILVGADGRVQSIRPGVLARADKEGVSELRKRIDALLVPK